MKRALLALCLLLVPLALVAQTVSTSVNLSWTAPTQNTDGSSISGALTYTLYQAPSLTGPFTVAASGITGSTTVVTSTKAGNCFALAAVEAVGSTSTSEGPLTPTICVPVPNSPTGLSISIILTVK